MNTVLLEGNLVREVDFKYTEKNLAICNFTIAVNEGYGDNKKTTYVPVSVFNKLAEACANNISKGSHVIVMGSLNGYEYKDKEGNKRYRLNVLAREVRFLDRNDKNRELADELAATGVNSMGKTSNFTACDEDIPF